MDSSDNTTRLEVTQIFSQEEVSFDYYSCKEAIDRLNDYLDHELDDAERADVARHLQICQPCLERFHFEETLIVQIKAKVAGFVAPKSLRERLGSAIRSVKGR